MGNTLEVWTWKKIKNSRGKDDWDWVQIYAGEHFPTELLIFLQEKSDGETVVKLEWREK